LHERSGDGLSFTSNPIKRRLSRPSLPGIIDLIFWEKVPPAWQVRSSEVSGSASLCRRLAGARPPVLKDRPHRQAVCTSVPPPSLAAYASAHKPRATPCRRASTQSRRSCLLQMIIAKGEVMFVRPERSIHQSYPGAGAARESIVALSSSSAFRSSRWRSVSSGTPADSNTVLAWTIASSSCE
jgi:hypothetical protein